MAHTKPLAPKTASACDSPARTARAGWAQRRRSASWTPAETQVGGVALGNSAFFFVPRIYEINISSHRALETPRTRSGDRRAALQSSRGRGQACARPGHVCARSLFSPVAPWAERRATPHPRAEASAALPLHGYDADTFEQAHTASDTVWQAGCHLVPWYALMPTLRTVTGASASAGS